MFIDQVGGNYEARLTEIGSTIEDLSLQGCDTMQLTVTCFGGACNYRVAQEDLNVCYLRFENLKSSTESHVVSIMYYDFMKKSFPTCSALVMVCFYH